MSAALLERFRAQWLAGSLPMVVEHRPGCAETLCAAPSLWMGGRHIVEGLRSAGVGAGHEVVFVGASAAGYVQTLVGCLRARACLRAPRSGDDPGTAAAFVGDDLVVSRGDAAATVPTQARVRLADGALLTDDDLDDLARALPTIVAGDATRMGTPGRWDDDRETFAVELLGALVCGLELHVVRPGVTAAQVAAIGCLPELIYDGGAEWTRRDHGLLAALRRRVSAPPSRHVSQPPSSGNDRSPRERAP